MPTSINLNKINPFLFFLSACLNHLFISKSPEIALKSNSTDSEFYVVTADDADPDITDVCEPAFLVSLILRAAQGINFKTESEIKQFLLDFPRAQKVLDNGVEVTKESPLQVLERWASSIASETKLPKDRIKAIIATLNQGAGYGAATPIMRFGASKGADHLMFSTMHRSQYSACYLERNGNVLRFCRSVPLHALNMDTTDTTDPNHENPDMVVTSKVTINLNYFKLQQSGPTSNIELAPNAVTQCSVIHSGNNGISLNPTPLSKYKYQDADKEGFVLVADQDLVGDLGWVMTGLKP